MTPGRAPATDLELRPASRPFVDIGYVVRRRFPGGVYHEHGERACLKDAVADAPEQE